ncbi:MAG: cation:dicarboxylase symporter family transporter [Verrucomicrobia bacterium]|nr:cation:dicarboxylase symporter family transporter [Verrucomicrobiota bacterium]MDE3047740.1 dicarboxylate/amino acid:cation symporter [Verrucomicrobiota bacterium]
MLKWLSDYNKHLILLSVASGILFGLWTPSLFESVQFLGTTFINLLKLFALPLICSALIAALGDLSGNLSTLKSLSKKLVGYMLVSEIMAVTIALCLFNLFKPGVGGDGSLILNAGFQPVEHQEFGFSRFVLSIIPENIFYSLTHFEVLPVVIFSILFGLGCTFAGEAARPCVKLAISIREASTKCLNGVMFLAPLGIFALVGSGVAQSHLHGDLKMSFLSLLSFVAVLILGLFLHGLWQLIAVAAISKQRMGNILQKSLPVFSTAFGTSSSLATLPVAMHVADSLEAKPFVTRLMLPICASINVGGMMMYEMGAALFFSQMLGLDLTLSQQILLAIACILGGMAEGGIPETSMVSLIVVFKIVNIPLSAISFLLPLDRIIDRLRTMVNIFGNMCGVILVSKLTEESPAERFTQNSG